MNERPCLRCGHPVLLQDGHLVFCSQCGAPQIFLSEQMQSELAETARSYAERSTSGHDPAASAEEPEQTAPSRWRLFQTARSSRNSTRQHAWTLAVEYALLSSAVALGLGLFSLAVPPLSLFLLLWIASAPILTVSVFHVRSEALPPFGPAFAARLGLLTALLVASCAGVVFTLNLVLSRFLLHDATLLDAQLNAAFTQQRTAVLARLGNDALPTLNMFTIPEFRVGLILTVFLASAVLYLLLSTVAGGIAGLLLRRRRA